MKRILILKTLFFWKFSPAEYMYNQIVTRDLKESTTLNFIAMATKHGWNICVHVYSMKFSGNHWKQSSSSHLERKCKIGLKKIKVVPHPRLLQNWIWYLFLKTWEENPLKDDNLCMFIPEREPFCSFWCNIYWGLKLCSCSKNKFMKYMQRGT